MAGQAPHIRAVVEADDKLAPELKRLLDLASRFGADMGQSLDKIGAHAMATADKFKMLGAAEKEALNVNMARAFEQALSGTATQTDKAAGGMRRFKEHTLTARQALKEMAETAKILAGMHLAAAPGHMIHTGGEYTAARAGLLATNPDAKEMAMYDKAAADLSRRYSTTTKTEVLQTIAEIRGEIVPHEKGATSDPKAVIMLADLATQADRALKASNVEGGFSGQDLKNLVKFAEKAGEAHNPQFIARLLESFVKAKQVDRNFVNSGDYFTFLANAKAAGMTLSEEYLTKTLPVMLAMSQAPRLGNEIAQTIKSLAGGNVLKGTGQWLADIGLIKQDQLVKTSPGTYKIKGGVNGLDLLMTDPQAWTLQYLLPALEKKGLTDPTKLKESLSHLGLDDHKASTIAASMGIQASGLRATVIDLLVEMIGNREVIEKNKAKVQNALGFAAEKLLDVNFPMATKAFGSALTNLIDILTSPALAAAAKHINAFASEIATFSGWIDDHLTDKQKGALGTAAVLGTAATATWAFSGLGALAGSGPVLLRAGVALEAAAAAQGRAAIAGTASGGVGAAGAAAAGGAGRFLFGQAFWWGLGAYAGYEALGAGWDGTWKDRPKSDQDWFTYGGPEASAFGLQFADQNRPAPASGEFYSPGAPPPEWGEPTAPSRMGTTKRWAPYFLDEQNTAGRLGDTSGYTFGDVPLTTERTSTNNGRGAKYETKVDVTGSAEVVQTLNVVVSLDGQLRQKLEQVINIGLSPAKVGTDSYGSQGAAQPQWAPPP